MNKYFIYARKSSEQEDRQMLSIGSQTKELKLLAKKLNIKVETVLEESQSAKSPGRPVFANLMEKVYSGEAKGVLCWKLDRLARNPVDGGSIIWAIKESGIEIITPAQTFNQKNENSILMYIEFGMAQKFVDDLSKNVKRGLNTKAEMGWLPSGAKPGYMNDVFAKKGNKTVVKDPERFVLIQKAWELMLRGSYSPTKILYKLNGEWGYRTPKHTKIGGKPMSRSQIYKTFTDPFYYGEFEYPEKSGNWFKGKHEPMITRDDFDRVQVLLGRKGKPKPKTHEFAYTGLMVCGECNSMITAEEKWQIICPVCKTKFHKGAKTDTCNNCGTPIENMENPKILHYVYYHCTKKKNPHCTQGSIILSDLEKQIDEILAQIQISNRFTKWAIRHLNEARKRSKVETLS